MSRESKHEKPKMKLDYILNELGEDRKQYYGAMAPPIIQSSNFAFSSVEEFKYAINHESASHIYTRGNNPTVEILRKKLAALEETEDALLFGSGSAAVSSAIMSSVSQGDHIICVNNPYSWTKSLLTNYLPRFGVEHTFVDGSDLSAIEMAIKENTRVIYLESPNTFTYELQDLEAFCKIAKNHGLITMIDNSYATPIFQKPSRFGIDLILHSVTKYLNGHSDVVAGVICGSKERIQKMFFGEYMTLGAVLSPSDASLIIRGLRTLPIRMQRIFETSKKVTEFLDGHPKIEKIYYPYSPSFRQYALAQKQMSGCSGLFTIAVKSDRIENVLNMVDRFTVFRIAVSWGGPESLVLPIAALYNLPERDDPALPWNYLRLSIGLEDAEYLIRDISSALKSL